MQDTHSTWYRHKSETTVLPTPDTQKQDEGIGSERQMPSASSQGPKKPHARAPTWDNSTFEGSPLLFQWGCSPLQVLWKPSAGGHRPTGSSTVQHWAQPMVGRWEQGGAPEMALLVGARGTRKGKGTPSRDDGRAEERISPSSSLSVATHLHMSLCLAISTSKPPPQYISSLLPRQFL